MQFASFADFFTFSMTSLLAEVRYRIYWVLSNIFGSSNFCFSYGLQFFMKIYQEKLYIDETQNENILR